MIVLAESDADPVDRIRAFDRGADDVVDRPIVYMELLARIRAVLRRAAAGDERELLFAGDIVVDRRTRRVTVAGVPAALAGKEFELAAKLATDRRRCSRRTSSRRPGIPRVREQASRHFMTPQRQFGRLARGEGDCQPRGRWAALPRPTRSEGTPSQPDSGLPHPSLSIGRGGALAQPSFG